MDASKNIAQALRRVKEITKKRGADIVQAKEIKRADRELLIRTNWLKEIMRGWYMLARPDVAVGDSGAWYANFWEFLNIYLNERFGDDYCLSAESSLELYTEMPIIPKQVIIIVTKGGSSNYSLLHDTSMLIYADKKNFPEDRKVINGLQVFPLETALCKATPTYFKNSPENAEIALRLVKAPSELSKAIIKLNAKSAANRIVGAYQFLGASNFAKTIREDLEAIGMLINAENPFKQAAPLILHSTKILSPYAARIEALWAEMREQIDDVFPKAPGLPKNSKKYLTHVDEVYEDDAYNSLSIEGYKVTFDLIERVKNNNWNPDLNLEDKNTRNALAAKGYYEAFQEVKKTVGEILTGKNAGKILHRDLQAWYRKLFLPSTQAGIISIEQLIGYRNDRVHIRGSRHVPPPKEAVVDSMEALFNCIQQEKSPSVRAILGHYMFVFIHPYMDGNGRISRFLMNAMLASGGYPWTVIEVTKRTRYMNALKIADEERNLRPFAKFILDEMNRHTQS
jgi:hypothetical protein